ncbi:MAG: tetratricopeptide repeat protein [Candidatus Aminicenantes bacterium]|nr:tetratricopeptide repeat protein [Candidatus Aminicenantes bacterium]
MKRLPGAILIILIFLVVSGTVFLCPAVLYGQEKPREENARETGSKDGLVPVPNPLLDLFEEAVNRQLHEKRQEVDTLAGKPGVNLQQLASAYGDLGQLYHAYELTEAAGACYRNALALDPANLEWRYSLGYLLQSVGQYSEALDLYQEVKTGGQNPPLDYLVYIRIGECYRNLNQPDQAKGAIEAAFRIDPEGPAVLARLGEIALPEKRYDDAIKYLVSALEKQPAANKLHYPLGMAYRGAGDMEKARFHMSKYGMVDVQPPDPVKTRFKKLVIGYHTHLLSGKMAFSAKRYTEAIEAFQKAIKADTEKPGAKVDMGAALAKLGKYKQAVTQFEAAIKLAPDNTAAHFNLGKVYAFFGNHKKAIEHFQVVVEKNPKDAESHLGLADSLRNERQFVRAFEHYKTALKLEPALTSGWLDISKLFSLAGQHGEALHILEKAHTRMPHNDQIAHAFAHLLAASPDLKRRQGQRALDLAMKVFQTSKNHEHARTVAISYAQLDLCDKAVEWMETAIELASNSQQPGPVLEVLKRNLAHFKTQRPCRTPAKK